MPKWDRPGFKTVNVEVSVTEWEVLAKIARDGGWPVDEVIVRLMRLGFKSMAAQTGMTPEAIARRG